MPDSEMIAVLAATIPDDIDLADETRLLAHLVDIAHVAEYRPTEVGLAFDAIVAAARALRAERAAA
jgi:hypothetical protein